MSTIALPDIPLLPQSGHARFLTGAAAFQKRSIATLLPPTGDHA
jgi:hypothetical protein